MVTVFRYTSHRFGTHLILHFLTSTFSGALFQTLVIDSENKKAALLVTGERLIIGSWEPVPFLKMKKPGFLWLYATKILAGFQMINFRKLYIKSAPFFKFPLKSERALLNL